MRLLVFLLGFLFVCVASQTDAQEVYRWIDETGKIHLVDEINRVPAGYRDQIKVYRVSSGQRKRPSIQREEVPQRASQMPQNQEQTEKSALTGEERTARIEALRVWEKALEEERNRQRILQRRFGGARATFYKKKVELLNQEIEAIQEELDRIRPRDR